ncbi:MAG: hypothetical protein JSS02_04510 [Planctomycetes bacterium]|nr:hypothetical protein [Planctomycetota bacterium]
MPPWPGGPCPGCGEEMPVRLIHCRTCRTLLNTDLEPDSVEIPAFVPLQEIEAVSELPARGYYIACPHCDRELRINGKYLNQSVTCKHCSGKFPFEFASGKLQKIAVYVRCPNCPERLRMSLKYLGIKVACKDCGARIIVQDPP